MIMAFDLPNQVFELLIDSEPQVRTSTKGGVGCGVAGTVPALRRRGRHYYMTWHGNIRAEGSVCGWLCSVAVDRWRDVGQGHPAPPIVVRSQKERVHFAAGRDFNHSVLSAVQPLLLPGVQPDFATCNCNRTRTKLLRKENSRRTANLSTDNKGVCRPGTERGFKLWRGRCLSLLLTLCRVYVLRHHDQHASSFDTFA